LEDVSGDLKGPAGVGTVTEAEDMMIGVTDTTGMVEGAETTEIAVRSEGEGGQ
jgi:hypothetical protein